MFMLLRTPILCVLLLSASTALASPRDDARYLVVRELDPETQNFIRGILNNAFAAVYSRHYTDLGIEIIDDDRFIALIPNADIEPYVDRFLQQRIDNYLSVYSPEQIATFANVLRLDPNASLADLWSEDYQRQHVAALKEARLRVPVSGSTDPEIMALEELVVQLDAVSTILDENAEEMGQQLAVSIAPIFTLVRYGHEIQRLQREFDNPVTRAALKADGILRFANPVQRQTIMRQLFAQEERSGIQFIRPPVPSAGSD